MPRPERLWQFITLILAVALVAALVLLHQATTAIQPALGTLPNVDNVTGYEQLALSPNARRVHERYSL